MKIDVEVDRLTPCLIDRRTREVVQTSYCRAVKKDLVNLQKRGWLFDWTDCSLKDTEIFKLTLKVDSRLQGLISLSDLPSNGAMYVNLAESAPENRGSAGRYEGVGGHLFAIAAQESMTRGYGGFFFLDAKNMELVKHYEKMLGACRLGGVHPYRMLIEEDAAARLIDTYTFERS